MLIAKEDIEEGEEITLDYNRCCSDQVDERRQYLKDFYGFWCNCPACKQRIQVPEAESEAEWAKADIPYEEVSTSRLLGNMTQDEIFAKGAMAARLRSFHEYATEQFEEAQQRILKYRKDLDIVLEMFEFVIGEELKRKIKRFGVGTSQIELCASN